MLRETTAISATATAASDAMVTTIVPLTGFSSPVFEVSVSRVEVSELVSNYY